MPVESTYDPQQRKYVNRNTTTKEEVESALSKSKLSTLKGAGIAGKQGRSPAPKQEPGESLSSFSKRMREYREKDADGMSRVKALK